MKLWFLQSPVRSNGSTEEILINFIISQKREKKKLGWAALGGSRHGE